MENKFLIDLSVKYGLEDSAISKISSLAYQFGYKNVEDEKFQKMADFICAEKLIDLPKEQIIEELKRKGFEEA
jgi:hypothetical protein